MEVPGSLYPLRPGGGLLAVFDSWEPGNGVQGERKKKCRVRKKPAISVDITVRKYWRGSSPNPKEEIREVGTTAMGEGDFPTLTHRSLLRRDKLTRGGPAVRSTDTRDHLSGRGAESCQIIRGRGVLDKSLAMRGTLLVGNPKSTAWEKGGKKKEGNPTILNLPSSSASEESSQMEQSARPRAEGWDVRGNLTRRYCLRSPAREERANLKEIGGSLAGINGSFLVRKKQGKGKETQTRSRSSQGWKRKRSAPNTYLGTFFFILGENWAKRG